MLVSKTEFIKWRYYKVRENAKFTDPKTPKFPNIPKRLEPHFEVFKSQGKKQIEFENELDLISLRAFRMRVANWEKNHLPTSGIIPFVPQQVEKNVDV